ncbi:MarR family transcriptional regulator, 2-MHQ and catechol-resistance regulon repressor [Granulicella rosea]|uniref:MarR family transcriptional regulator, 2-MHQ and catechol-resistance regulon repressor n=1 Tax=Granulicella rosea TaxID=474952 RepID=A0A239M2R5_9BACT|nr:MarR family transcriptional regulator [Granulicella rosea]SNT36981.1 MarR family transcriptional regulator, 2-MHQ and catechol-resistance regulon repressor [Granulicella rosea]
MTDVPTAGQLWIVLVRCTKALTEHVEQSVAEAGLVLTDFMILEALLHKGPLTITEIQSKILLASGSMTAAVDRLERKGCIVRRSIQQDRRARQLELTPDGRALIERIYASHKAEFEALMSVLGDDERRQTYASLKKLGLHAAAAHARR